MNLPKPKGNVKIPRREAKDFFPPFFQKVNGCIWF